MDDAFITIATEDFIVAHGNDNWQELPPDVEDVIKTDFAKYDKKDTLFMSQTNMADGFPLIYENYTPEEKAFLAKRRQDNMIISSVKNAHAVNAGAFLSYAGMAIPFIKGQDHLLDDAYCKSLDYVNDLLVKNNIDNSIVLDMVAGDSYDFNKVDKLFGNQYYNHDDIKDASVDFYKKYEWVNNCDTYQEPRCLSPELKSDLLNLFLDNFKDFVKGKYEKTDNFHEGVFDIKLTFKDSDIEKTIQFNDDAKIEATFTFDVVPMEKILLGDLNWECCYVGYESRVHVNGDHNIGAMIRWLTMYGYVYQQRIFPGFAKTIQ